VNRVQALIEARVSVPLDWHPDGDRVLVQSNRPGTLQLYEQTEAGDVRQLTDELEPVSGRYLRSDLLIVSRDNGGDERHQLFTLVPGGSLKEMVFDPAYVHALGDVSRDGRFVAYTTNRRNSVDFDVVVREVDAGTERVVLEGGGYLEVANFSPDGRYLAVWRPTDRTHDLDLLLVDLDSGEVTLTNPRNTASVAARPGWLGGSGAFLAARDQDRDLPSVDRYDVASGTWVTVYEPGCEFELRVDPTGTRVLISRNVDGVTRAEVRDASTFALLCEVDLPHTGVADMWRFCPDGGTLIFRFSSARVPGDVFVFDVASAQSYRATESPCEFDTTALPLPEQHSFTSFDGERISTFLHRPGEPGDRPVVVVVHGGPESQSIAQWSPVISLLVSEGYAVAVPNVRGSAGYGKRFEQLDDVERRLDSVADLRALHEWITREPGLDAGRAALYGGSYGGYMVLAGLTFQPELWAAGVDIVGISSLVTFLENTSAYRRKVREREYGSLERDREFLLSASPLTHVDELRAPLIIIHGANDPRVPLGEAQQIHATLTDKGIATELLVYDDEGHGLQKLKNRLDAYPKVLAFLSGVLS
jgi:dipeptidyl aminopeptidase/acylaminoacyl peptidase